ncbi:MAG: transcription termination/antitermination NusG family protein [Planctomycetota bacterium]
MERDGDGVCPDFAGLNVVERPQLPVARRWAAAWTRSRAEKALREYLQIHSVPVFLPLVLSRRVYGRLVRQSQLPLFPGYLFYDAEAISRPEIFASRHVADVLVPDDPQQLRSELESLALALGADASLRECRLGAAGTPVEVVRGPLKGVRGELVRFQAGHRLVLQISFLGKSAELAIDEAFVTRLS